MHRHRILGVLDVVVGLALLGLIWTALPARWTPLDVSGSLLSLSLVGSGVALILHKPWAARVGRIVGAATLAIGMLLVSALAITAAHLWGLYGPVGRGATMILALVAALLAPYLVGLPAAQVWLLRSRDVAK